VGQEAAEETAGPEDPVRGRAARPGMGATEALEATVGSRPVGGSLELVGRAEMEARGGTAQATVAGRETAGTEAREDAQASRLLGHGEDRVGTDRTAKTGCPARVGMEGPEVLAGTEGVSQTDPTDQASRDRRDKEDQAVAVRERGVRRVGQDGRIPPRGRVVEACQGWQGWQGEMRLPEGPLW
jgi:hypothetical protein